MHKFNVNDANLTFIKKRLQEMDKRLNNIENILYSRNADSSRKGNAIINNTIKQNHKEANSNEDEYAK